MPAMQTAAVQDVFETAHALQDGSLTIRHDHHSQLTAIIAIDSLKRGPALGGCRCIHYASTSDALRDAARLARGMTLKAALAKLPFGGGKAVILRPATIPDHQTFFTAFGRMVNSLQGAYITAMDAGTSISDMHVIARATPFIASLTTVADFPTGDPSSFTALGIVSGMRAAALTHLGRDTLNGLRVAIQGVGHVGQHLAQLLHEAGAKLVVADVSKERLAHCVSQFNAEVEDISSIHAADVDIFSPCAFGAVINDNTVQTINAKIVAGCANNQLATKRHGILLHERGILYAPDYAINAGGLIYATEQYQRTSESQAKAKVMGIYDTMLDIFERSMRDGVPPAELADHIAAEILIAS